jgi:hypothetical protein
MRNWLPVEVTGTFTVEQLEAGGLYSLSRASAVHTRIASQRIGARTAETAEARVLHICRGAALLTMKRTTIAGGPSSSAATCTARASTRSRPWSSTADPFVVNRWFADAAQVQRNFGDGPLDQTVPAPAS